MNLVTFRRRNKITAMDCVEALRPEYPGIDKTLISKLEHPEKYGAQLTPAAQRALSTAFREAADGRRSGATDRHKLRRRAAVRLTDEQWSVLQLALRITGMTMQDAMLCAVSDWLRLHAEELQEAIYEDSQDIKNN